MLDDRVAFVALSQAGSFAKAARRLGVARSTVMRRVDLLEEELGVRLVQRAGRNLVLTSAGEQLAKALAPLLRQLSLAEQRVVGMQGAVAGELRVWLPILGTNEYLVPSVAAFQKAHPEVVVHLEMGRDMRQLEFDSFDLAMQTSLRINPELSVRTLFWEKMVLVASREYLERAGVPKSPDDLKGQVAVYEKDVEGKIRAWRYPDGSRAGMPPPSVVVNSVGHAYALAKKGAGITRAPYTLASSDLATGHMAQVLPSVWSKEPVSFVFLPDPPPVTRACLEFMTNWFE